jgi:cytochrome P450
MVLQSLGWGARPMPFMARCHARYGDMFTLTIAQAGKFVFVAHPDMVKQVFTGSPEIYHAGEGNSVLLPVVGRNSVLTLDRGEHIRQRKLLLPPFHGERMQRYGELMREITAAEIESWPDGEPFAAWPRMQAITLDVILRAVFGVEEGATMDTLRERLRKLLEASTDPLALIGLAVLGPKVASRFRVPFFTKIVREVDEAIFAEIERRRRAPDLAERDDILSMLVQARDEDGNPMTDEELRDELVTLLVAGHETTATSLAWALERLVRHPDKLERLTAEVEDGGDAQLGKQPARPDAQLSPYMDAVIKETLRLRPVLAIVVRTLQEPVEIGGYRLPAGVSVVPAIHLMHRRPDIYPDPMAFRPERFLEQPAGTYTWLPFGGGIRRCLGASFAQFEMKQVLAEIVSRVQLEPSTADGERIVRRAITHTPGAQATIVARPRAAPLARAGAESAAVPA